MMNRNKGEEKKGKGTRGGQVPFSPRPSLAHSLTFHLLALRLSLFHTHTQRLLTGLVRFYQQTLTHTAPTFASLNSLICTYARVCVCVGLLSLFPLPAKKLLS